jgi:hypothetical protein
MKRAIVLAAMMAACLPLAAQQSPKLYAAIPFTFELADKVMPAGEYRITPSASMHGFVLVENTDLRGSTYVLASLKSSGGIGPGDAQLVFNKYEDRHFLARIAFLDRDCSVVKSKSEKEMVTSRVLKASAPPVEVKIMAAAR